MNKKNIVILGLLVVAATLFSLIQFWFLPAGQAEQEAYVRNQTDALTHDISAVEAYRSAYIGDASNVGGLFEALPLNDLSKKYEIDSDDCTLTVNYLDAVWNIGEEKVHRDLLYNTVAAMAAIDNLSGITYQFSGDRFCFEREEIENVFGAPLSKLLVKETWDQSVQDRLGDANFVGQFYSR